MTHTPPDSRRSKTARLLDAVTHSGPGYDLTPAPDEQPAAAPSTPELEQEWRQQLIDAIGPNMHLGLQDAELHDEPGAQRIGEWVDWIASAVLPIVRDAVADAQDRIRTLDHVARGNRRPGPDEYTVRCYGVAVLDAEDGAFALTDDPRRALAAIHAFYRITGGELNKHDWKGFDPARHLVSGWMHREDRDGGYYAVHSDREHDVDVPFIQMLIP